MDLNIDKTMNMRTDKLNPLGVFQNNIGKADLTRAENISRSGIYDLNTDPTVIVVGMVEGTADRRSVSVVFCHAVAVVDQKVSCISAEIAVQEHIVSAVVDAPVSIACAMHIGKLMKFAEMRNVNSNAAPCDMTV